MDIQHLALRLGKELNRHAPTILTTLGVVGVAATAYLTAKATTRAIREIDAEFNTGEPAPAKKVVAISWRYYVPAVSMGLATGACVIAANTISVKRQTALIGAYALSERALSAYREKMENEIGAAPERYTRGKIAQDAIENNPLADDELVDIPLNKDIFLDKFTGQYFGSDVETVREAMTEVNRKTLDEGYASMNYFFSLIGARRTDIGEVMGWTEDRMLDIDLFPLETKDGRVCIVIDYRRQPVMEYHRVW